VKTEFSVFQKVLFVAFLFLAACQTSNSSAAGPVDGDINTKCSPEFSIPELKVKYVGAYFSLSNFNRETELAKAQIIPYFYEFKDEVYTLRLSDKNKYRHAKYRHAKGVVPLSSEELKNSTISNYYLINNTVLIRAGPDMDSQETGPPFKSGARIIGRGPVRDRDGNKWLQVIRNKKVIGYTAERFFKKLQDITHPPTFNLDCRKDNLEEKFRESAEVFPKFDVRFISPPPDGWGGYFVNLTDRLGGLKIKPRWSEDGYMKLQEFNEELGEFFRFYQQTIKGDPGKSIKFVFDKPNLGIAKGRYLELPGEFLAASPSSDTPQASPSKRGQPELIFEDQLYIRTATSDLSVRARPELSLPKNKYVMRGDETIVYESENQEWWEFRHYDVQTRKPGRLIGYHWVGIPTSIKVGGSTPTRLTAKKSVDTRTQKQNTIAEKLKPRPPEKSNVLIKLPENEIYRKLSSKDIRLSDCKFKASIDDVYTFECTHQKKKPYKLKVLDYEPIVIKKLDITKNKILKSFAPYKKEISPKELKKPYLITFPTRAMLFYETGNLNWKKEARKALNKKESEIVLKILLSAEQISRGVPLSVPGGKNNSCDIIIEKRHWDDPNLSVQPLRPPCVVQTFVNETGISELGKTYRISGCLQTKVLGKHHLCLKKPKNTASFYPNERWVGIPGNPENETTSIKKKMLRPLPPILSTDPWLRKTKIAQDICNIRPHYQIVDVRYCKSKGSCPTRFWKIAKDKSLKLASLDEIGWNFKFLPSEVDFRFKKITGEGFQNKPRVQVKIGKKTKLSSLIRPPKQKLISGPAIITDFGNIPADLSAKFALFTSKKQCDSAVKTRSKYWRPYHPNHNGEMKAHQCTYAKVLRGREKLSNCVLPKRVFGKWVYSFVKDKFQGKRRVILITDAEAFGGRRGKKLKNILTDWLIKLKKNKAKKPVTVMQIKDDGTIKTVIRAEDLKGLKESSKTDNERSIRRLVNSLSFSGEGFRPLEHLVDFEAKIGSDLQSVLFITTPNGIPANQFVKNSQLGTTLGWSTEDTVSFKVYSTGRCDFWTKKARADDCKELKKKGTNLKRLLEEISK